MPAFDPSLVSITSATASQRVAALGLILSDWTAYDRNYQISHWITQGHLSWDTLLVAQRGERVVAAAWGMVQPGRVVSLWMPRSVAGEAPETAAELYRCLETTIRSQGVEVIQCLLPEAAQADEDLLLAQGFVRLATLDYLTCRLQAFPRVLPTSDLDFEAYGPHNHDRLREMVEATYEQTLDCPQLNGVRAIEDVLASYRANGVFNARRWLLVRHDGRDVGCLLLADYPDNDNWELVYMGIRPEWRGHGWGGQLVRQAQWMCRQSGRSQLVLAVDAQNSPAMRVYSDAGFEPCDRRVAYLKVLKSVSEIT
jgi:mycothiol synthase